MVVFAEFESKFHKFFNKKIGDCKLKVLWGNYGKDRVLGSVETNFLEVGAYVSLKRVISDIWEGRVYRIWVKIPQFLNIKTGDLDLKISLFNYSNDLVLRWVETYSGRCCINVSDTSQHSSLRVPYWIWVKIPQVFSNIIAGEWNLKISLFNYWNYIVLGSVETHILDVGAYVCLKRATTGV